MPNKFIAEVEAGLFGDGFTIRLDMDGLGKLETEFGEFDFVHKVQYGLAILSPKYISAFLKVALRDADGKVTRAEIPSDIPLAEVGKRCLDSFSLFRYGKDAETMKAEADAEKKANPTKGTKA